MCKILNEVELVAVVIIRKLRPYPSTKQPPLNGPQNRIFDSVFKLNFLPATWKNT